MVKSKLVIGDVFRAHLIQCSSWQKAMAENAFQILQARKVPKSSHAASSYIRVQIPPTSHLGSYCFDLGLSGSGLSCCLGSLRFPSSFSLFGVPDNFGSFSLPSCNCLSELGEVDYVPQH